MNYLIQRLKFLLERFIVRGPFHRLLVMAGLIFVIASSAGLLAWSVGLFEQPAEAAWWAFLRLTDPGYLGDDEGTFKRMLSTTVTVLGYVVFMGALIAIMTQWFHATMARLQSGVTPVAMQDHIVVFGWTNRTAAIVRELMVSKGRVRRFYQRRGERESALRVVILADDPAEEVREELRRVLGELYTPRQIVVRVGNPLRAKHLKRVDFLNAATAILPADPRGVSHPTNVDAATVKTLLSTSHAALELADRRGELPLIVAELTDDRKTGIGVSAYRGPVEILATDRIIARLLAQSIRHRGISAVYGELLGYAHGNEVYVREWTGPQTTFRDAVDRFPGAVPVGIVRQKEGGLDTELRPSLDAPVASGERLVMIASTYAATLAGEPAGLFDELGVSPTSPAARRASRRVLLLGWSRKVPVLLEEFDAYDGEQFDVEIVSMVDPTEREREIDRRVGELDETTVRHHHIDFASEDDLQDIDLATFDSITLLGADWLESDALSDARTLLGYLVVRTLLDQLENPPSVILELLEPESEPLIQHRPDDIIISPVIVSHMLTQIGLRRELGEVFEELFGPHGAEIAFRELEAYGVEPGETTFREVRAAVAQRSDIAIGLRCAGGVELSPEVDELRTLAGDDRIIALTFL